MSNKKVTKKTVKVEFKDGKLKIDDRDKELQVTTILSSLVGIANVYKGMIEEILDDKVEVNVVYSIKPKT